MHEFASCDHGSAAPEENQSIVPPKCGTINRHYVARFGRIITREDGGHSLQIIFALAFAAFAGTQTGDEMPLRRADAVAAIAFGRKRVIVRPLRVAVFVEPDAAVAREPDFSALAFDDQLLGDWFATRGAADSVSVDQTARAVFKLEIDQRVILTLDARVDAPHPAEDAPELAQQKPERVDEMHDHFVNQQPLHLAAIRLRRVRRRARRNGASRSRRNMAFRPRLDRAVV